MNSETDNPTQAMLDLCQKYKMMLDGYMADTQPNNPEDKFRRIGFTSALEELTAVRVLLERLQSKRIGPEEMAEHVVELRSHALENRTRYEGRVMVHDFLENAMASIMIEFYGLPGIAPVRGEYAKNRDTTDDGEDEKIPFIW